MVISINQPLADAKLFFQRFDSSSLVKATGNRMTLRTDIDTRTDAGAPKVTDTLVVSHTPFGPRDWRGLVFDAPVPSRLAVGASHTLRGSIDPEILPGRYQFLILRAARYGDVPSDAVTIQATVRGGRFSVPLRFASDQIGAYEIDIFVFVDAQSPAISTSVVTSLFVE